MVDYQWSDLEGTPNPNSPNSWLQETIDVARDAACEYYSEGPGSAAGSALSYVGLGAIDSLWRRICRPGAPQPPPPRLPNEGGQCPVVYSVIHRVGTQSGGLFPAGTTNLRGPVKFGRGPSNAGDQQVWGIFHAEGFLFLISTGINETVIGGIQSVSRLDGQPDSCGNPAPELPQSRDLREPPRQRPPVLLPPAPGLPRIPIPPIVIPPIRPPVSLPSFPPIPGVPFLPIPWKPEINVDVGGVQVTFDLGGVTFNVRNEFNLNLPSPQPGNPGGGGRPLPPAGGDCKDCCDEVTAIRERLNKMPAIGDFAASPGPITPASNGGRLPLGPLTAGVRIFDVVPPVNAKIQDGGGGPDVLWAGWGWFEFAGGVLGPRENLDSGGKFFAVDVDAVLPGRTPVAFNWTLYTGFTASVQPVALARV